METSSVRAGQAEKPIRAGWVKLVPSDVPETMEINDSGIDLEGQYLYRALQCFMKGTYLLLNIIMVITKLSVLLTNNDNNNNNNNNSNNNNNNNEDLLNLMVISPSICALQMRENKNPNKSN